MKSAVALASIAFVMAPAQPGTAQEHVGASIALAGDSPTSTLTPGTLRQAITSQAARLVHEATHLDLKRQSYFAPAEAALQRPRSPGDARIRITAASVVELPGVIHLEGVTATGSIVSSDDDTVTVPATGGRIVTLPRPGRKVIGVLAGSDEHMITVARDRGPAVTIPRMAIGRLERADGRRSRRRSAGLGFLIGGGGGAGIGYLIGNSCQPTGFLGCFLEPAVSTVGGLIIGGGAGALFGALARPAEQWKPVPVDWLNGQAPVHSE